jgi:peptidoglycan/xylan/chitin deacetylase (PgdA/CDA1 family)
MTIGCHGMRHRAWRRLDGRGLHEELVDAKRMLEDVVEGPVDEAACPFGSYDRRVLRFLRGAGYRRIYTSDRGLARPDEWIQTRNSVHTVDGGAVLDEILAAQRPAHRAFGRRVKQLAKRCR